MIALVPLDPSRVPDVSRLHRRALPGLLARLGTPAVENFYRTALRRPGSFGFVAVEDGEIAGFVFGSTEGEALFSAVAKASPVRTALSLIPALFTAPLSLARALSPARAGAHGQVHPAELTYIAVRPQSRNKGVGRALFAEFAKEAKRRGVARFELSVDQDDRDSIRFYESLSMRRVGAVEDGGLRRVRYAMEAL